MRYSFLFLLLFSCAITPAFAQNLVVNGSFESPALTATTYIGKIPGWTVSGDVPGEIQRGLAGVSGAEGKQWAELDANANTYIYQDINTVNGQRYVFLFRDANRPGDTNSQIQIMLNDVEIGHTTPTASAFRALTAGEFVATSSVTRIGFRAAGTSNSVGDLVDDVEVLPIDATGSFSGFNYYFPQVADGGGWLTTILLTSASIDAYGYTVTEYGDNGQTLFTSTGVGSQGGATTVATPGTASNVQAGWFHVKADAPASVVAIYRYRATGQPDFEASVPARAAVQKITGVFDNRNGFLAGLAVANPGTRAITLNFVLRSAAGAIVRTAAINVPSKGHSAFFLKDSFPETANILGRIEIEAVDAVTGADALFAPMGLRFSPTGPFTSIPY